MRAYCIALIGLALVACGTKTDGGDDGTVTATPSPSGWAAQDQAEIYRAVIGDNVKAPWIYDRVCGNAGGNPSQSAGTCDPMDAEVQAALQQLIPEAKFTSEFAKIDRQIMEGGGGILWRLGPVQGVGDQAKVSASYYCGSLCAGGVIHVIERVDGRWQETGTEGPEWIS